MMRERVLTLKSAKTALVSVEARAAAAELKVQEAEARAQEATRVVREARVLQKFIEPLRRAASIWRKHSETARLSAPDFFEKARAWVAAQAGDKGGPNPRLERLKSMADDFLGDPDWRAEAGRAVLVNFASTARTLWRQIAGLDNREVLELSSWETRQSLLGRQPHGHRDLVQAVAAEMAREAAQATMPAEASPLDKMTDEERQIIFAAIDAPAGPSA